MKTTNIQNLYAGLDCLHKPTGDIVFLHSSVLKLGQYYGGVDKLLQDIIDYYGPEITLGMPAFTFRKNPDDIWSLDTKTQMGALNNKLLQLTSSHRSIHPTHSCVFLGPRAESLAKINTPCVFQSDGVFELMVELDALNVSIGTEFIGGATFLHLCERRANVNYRFQIELDTVCDVPPDQALQRGYTYFARRQDPFGHTYENSWFELYYALMHSGVYKFNVTNDVIFGSMHMKEATLKFDSLLKADPKIAVKQ